MSKNKHHAVTAARLWCLASLIILPATATPLDWSIDVLPSVNLSGPPSSTVQWNYSITNLSDTDTLVLNSLNAGVFQYGMPMSIFDFPIVAPLGSALGPLYQFTFDSNAPIGFINSGTFDLTADFYIGEPSNDGTFDTSAPDKSVAYSVTVAGATVPEPGTFILVLAILPILSWKLRRRARLTIS